MQAPIQCRPAGAESLAQHLESIDISFGGLRIQSDEEYRVGAVVQLDIYLPSVERVTLTAEVIWTEALGQRAPARFDVGLAFVELHPDALTFLMTVLDSEVQWVGSTASKAEGGAAPDSSVEFVMDEPVSEVHPRTSEPPTLPYGRADRWTLSSTPIVVVDAAELHAARLDSRTASLVSLIDGITTVESFLAMSGMPEPEALEILDDLRRRGLVELIDPAVRS